MLFLRVCSGFCFENRTVNLPLTVFTPHLTVLVLFFFLHGAALNFLHSRVCHLRSICLCSVLSSSPCRLPPSTCVSPLALAPIFAQIHRAASAPRPSAPIPACRSTSPSRSAPNPPASRCRPSKTGEQAAAWRALTGGGFSPLQIVAGLGVCSDLFFPSE